MSYRCEDCRYTSPYFQNGVCPGCGSAHIRPVNRRIQPTLQARKPYRLLLACALWLYLVVEILRKLSG